MNPWVGILVTVLLLAVNGFFVAAEFAVTSSRRAQIEPLVDKRQRGADKAMYALEHVSLMLAICQLGITVMSTSLGVVAEPTVARLIEVPLVAMGISATSIHAVSFVIALLLVLFLHVVFGEMVPKNISISTPQKMLLWLAPPLVAIGHVVKPIVVEMDHLANRALQLVGIEPSSEISATFTVEEVANIVQLSQAEGKLQDELGLLSGTLEFSTENAGDVMVPTEGLLVLSDRCTPEQVERAVAQTGYSRFPVIRTDLLEAEVAAQFAENGARVYSGEEICGYIHLKDVLYAEGMERLEPVSPWRIRKFESISTDTEVEDALRMMQISGTHMAAVVCPHSGTQEASSLVGVIFLEDILELLVGEVRDSLQRKGNGY